eukprot:COSAG02_NODE_61346_length_269_cov_0.523529_1_plen_30_part_10
MATSRPDACKSRQSVDLVATDTEVAQYRRI